jgi:hypothetical protein
MVANLWDYFITDLCTDDAEMVNALVHPNSNILQNIKHFRLDKSDQPPKLTAIQ